LKKFQKISAAVLATGLVASTSLHAFANDTEKVDSSNFETVNLQDALNNLKDQSTSVEDLQTISTNIPLGYLANNLFALSLNIEKINNPTAKAAIQRNIEKAIAKWEEENKEENPSTEEPTAEEKAALEKVALEKAEEEAKEEAKKAEELAAIEAAKAKKEAEIAAEKAAYEAKLAEQQAAKEAKKAEKEAKKEERKAKKQQRKDEHNAKKQNRKEDRKDRDHVKKDGHKKGHGHGDKK
jgi:hypothetical protein